MSPSASRKIINNGEEILETRIGRGIIRSPSINMNELKRFGSFNGIFWEW